MLSLPFARATGSTPRWNVALNVNNVTDKTYYQTVGGSASGNWYGEPRSYMLTIRGSF